MWTHSSTNCAWRCCMLRMRRWIKQKYHYTKVHHSRKQRRSAGIRWNERAPGTEEVVRKDGHRDCSNHQKENELLVEQLMNTLFYVWGLIMIKETWKRFFFLVRAISFAKLLIKIQWHKRPRFISGCDPTVTKRKHQPPDKCIYSLMQRSPEYDGNAVNDIAMSAER